MLVGEESLPLCGTRADYRTFFPLPVCWPSTAYAKVLRETKIVPRTFIIILIFPPTVFAVIKKKTVVFCIVRDEMIEFRAVPSPLFPKAVFAGARVWLVTVIGFRTRPSDGRFTRTYVGGTCIGIRSRVNQNVSGPAGEKNIFTFVPRRRFDVRLVETLK